MSLRQRGYSELTEASEVKMKELEPENQKKVKAIQKVTKGKPTQFFSGIMGEIATFHNPGVVDRFGFDVLKKLVSLKIRWLEVSPREFHIGL